jgi:ABC-2 type transport system ATP-binding protein
MLVATGISHTYRSRKGKSVQALHGVGLTAREGSITAVVGPNGSGKSTLFGILAGLLRPDAGIVKYHGAPLRRDDMGVVFQSPALDQMLSVRENLLHHAMLYGKRLGNGLADHFVVKALGLPDLLDTRVEQLSGGYQRRVELAKALLPNPGLLLLDEALTGLDLHARREFLGLLRSLAVSSGLTALLVTHELDIATHCDHVIVLRQGRVLADSAPGALLEPLGDIVVEVRGVVSTGLKARFEAAGYSLLTGDTHTLLLLHASVHEVMDAVAAEGSDVVVEARKPTLGDWFILHGGSVNTGPREALAA